jgi:muramidase (phage lysozyme)
MTADLEQCRAWLNYANCRAFLRVIREGESGQDDSGYRIINGGSHFEAPPWQHPWPDGTPTTQGGKAAGAYQFLPSTWKRVADALGLPDFSPESQDIGAVYLIAGRGAIEDVLAGNLVAACSRLRDEWVSLPNMSLQRIQQVFVRYGGAPGQEGSPAAPDQAPTAPAGPQATSIPPTQKGRSMDPLSLIGIFGPVLAQLIPQVGTLFGGKKDAQNAQTIGTVLNTIVQATGQTGAADMGTVGTAIHAMQSDPAVKAAVTAAVVTHPDVIGLVEVGAGGIKQAKADSIAMQNAEKPFWFNPAFWISLLLMSLPVMLVVDVFYVHPTLYNGELRTQIITGVLGVIILVAGFWLGSSMGSLRKTELAAQATATDAAKS